MIVSIEGVDCAGKETQAKLLAEHLKKCGLNVGALSFPNYETETGQLIKKMLKQKRRLVALDKESGRVATMGCDEALLLQALMTANRYEATAHLNLWKFAKPVTPIPGTVPTGVLVLDRYWASGYAYGVADGLDPNWLLAIHRALPQPDFTFLLDIPVEVSFQRRPVREDAYEASVGRLEKARTAYLALAKRDAANWMVVDATKSVEEVHAAIVARVDQLLASVSA